MEENKDKNVSKSSIENVNTFQEKMDVSKKKIKVTKLGKRNVLMLLILGISGQIAWAVENTWFNTFVYDEITPDSTPIAWMVALSAITATITTLVMGALSDKTRSKLGRRRPYIFFGYIIWGIVTAIFPEPALLHDIGVAVVLIIILDCIMTFFGSTANDAAFNAWTTDISDSTNRGRVQGLLNICAFIANLIAFGIVGFVIENYGYFAFFYILGGSVSIMGLIGGLLLKEPPLNVTKNVDKKKGSIWIDIGKTLTPKVIKKNKILFLLLSTMAISFIGSNIYFPYLFIYMEYVVGFTKTLISIAAAIVILVGVGVSLVFGLISHRFNRKSVLIIAIIIDGTMLLIISIMNDIWTFGIAYMFVLSIETISGISLAAWIQDKYPIDEIGKFQGVRLIFMVAIPMVLGAPIGSMIIHAFGTPAIIDGKPGYIPAPHIFIFAGIFVLLSLIPLLFIPKIEGKIKANNVNEN
ncbi:MAG: MFS transporter [Promethearchaeota archaeon]